MVQIRKLRSAGLEPIAAAKLGIRKVGFGVCVDFANNCDWFRVAANWRAIGLSKNLDFCCVIGVVLTFIISRYHDPAGLFDLAGKACANGARQKPDRQEPCKDRRRGELGAASQKAG